MPVVTHPAPDGLTPEAAEVPATALSGQALVDALNEAETNDMLPAAGACVHGASLPDNFTGTLEMELNVDADGLTEAAVSDPGTSDVQFPQPVLDCLADVVWGVDWPGSADGDTTVKYRLMVTTD